MPIDIPDRDDFVDLNAMDETSRRKFTGHGKYSDPILGRLEGSFEGGDLVEGKMITDDGWIHEGTFDTETAWVIEGKVISPDGWIHEGTFDRNTGFLIEGSLTFPDGRVEHYKKEEYASTNRRL